MKVVTIDGTAVKTAEEIFNTIRLALELPQTWNEDQIYGYLAGVEQPVTVVVTDSVVLRRTLGARMRPFEDALAFAEQQNGRHLSVLFVD